MLRRALSRLTIRRRRRHSVLFVCSSPIDEIWIRGTALACHEAGLEVALVLCGGKEAQRAPLHERYGRAGISVIGAGSFAGLTARRADAVVTASSGLERNLLPEACRWIVHMPHSLASLHMIYPPDAFDAYDVLLAAGPHHVREFDALGRWRGAGERMAIPVGYGKLDLLRTQRPEAAPSKAGAAHVLIAPSWGPDNLLERMGVALATALLDTGYRVTVRPHPLFFLGACPVVAQLETMARTHESLDVESPFEGETAIHVADVLIGDYSGASFEFAAHRRRRVLSVDVGRKVINPRWKEIGLPPVEIQMRESIGSLVPPRVDAVAAELTSVLAKPDLDDDVIDRFVFRPAGSCAETARDAVLGLLQ